MITPVLHVSPGEVRNRNGLMVAGVDYSIGSLVSIIASTHGQAFDLNPQTGSSPAISVPVANIPGLRGVLGTVLCRYRVSAVTPVVFRIGDEVANYQYFALRSTGSANNRFFDRRTSATVTGNNPFTGTDATYEWFAFTWFSATARWMSAVGKQSIAGWELSSFSGAITLGPTTARNTQVENLMVFDTVLTDAQVDAVAAMAEGWTWDNVVAKIAATGPDPMFSSGSSSIVIAHPSIFRSDMAGNEYEEITDKIIDCRITSDIDRAGSKNRVQVTAVGQPDFLDVGSWISVRQDIGREGNGRQSVRRGVFELEQPELVSKRDTFEIQNSGSDLVDLLARSACLNTFYTPAGGLQLADAWMAIRMAGIASMGANLTSNGGFEDGVTGWNTGWNNGGATSSADAPTSVAFSIPEGKAVGRVQYTSSAVAGHYRNPYTDVTIPTSAQSIYVSGLLWKGHADIRVRLFCEFRNASGQVLAPIYDDEIDTRIAEKWHNAMMVLPVPAGATIARVGVETYVVVTTYTDMSVHMDDIRCGECIGSLLPANLIEFPESSTGAITRIQHVATDTRLASVNDRLAGLGYMAVNATPNSRFTTRTSRDITNDSPARTYTLGADARMIGEIRMARNAGGMYNRVFAVKEDFESGTSMIAMAENRDPADKWSIHYRSISPLIIQVTDAVSQAALQAVADAALLQATVQESIVLDVVPDGDISVYDIMEVIASEGHPANGRWAIENIESNLRSTNALMRISARRTANRSR